MERKICLPRKNWQSIVESQGMHYHTVDKLPYWNENAYYEFGSSEIDQIEKATYALNDMCLKAVEHVIEKQMWKEFNIPIHAIDMLLWSWENDEHTMYGRFDLVFGESNYPPKLLEYNADTPTALLEASVIQWHWLNDTQGLLPYKVDQFNSIHERLIEGWDSVLRAYPDCKLHFGGVKDNVEDYMTVNYLRDTAIQAGWRTKYIHMSDLRWNHDEKCFIDNEDENILMMFKLYPWEWMFANLDDPDCPFGPEARLDRTMWFEPAWKMFLSNKAILPVLYQLFPDSPYLLKASFEPFGSSYAKKPILSREGNNVTLVYENQVVAETTGEYEYTPYVYQELALLPDFDRNHPVIGSWMINGYAAGIGIREDKSLITGNTSKFVPHLFRR